MAEEGKFKKLSIFICTNEELIRALKKKQNLNITEYVNGKAV
jgi:hypothetical protein